jgi:tripartite-type tricarboxylate transporter receptor subunit TctC
VPNIAFGANPSMIKKMPFDSEKDLIPVTQVSVVSMVLVVNPSLPVRSVKELLGLAKARPAQLTFGSAGNATANHLAAGLFMQRTGADMVHVPYKGGGPAVVSLLSGETSLLFATIPAAIQHIQSGRLRALGVTRARRAAMLPDVATVAESGVPGYEAIEWNGVMVPAGTPMPVVRRIRDAIAKVLAPTEMKERLLAVGAEGVGSTPEEFSAFIRTELATWSKVVRELQLSVD